MTNWTDIAAEDKRLQQRVAQTGKEHDEAQMRLDAYRWEQCACPDGPKYSQREYAEQVGVRHQTIGKSVTAWGGTRTGATCTLGTPHPRDTKQPSSDAVNTGGKTADEHQGDRTKARVGEENALIVVALAKIGGVAESTVTNNTNWTQCLDRAKALVREGQSVEAAADVAHAEKVAEERRIKALRAQVRDALKAAGLDYGPKEVNAIMGQASMPPTWIAAQLAIEEEKRLAEIRKQQDRTHKENEAARAEQGGSLAFMELLAALKHTSEGIAKINGLDTIRWDDDKRELLIQACDAAQAALDRARLLPMAEPFTVENIVGEQA